MSWCFVSREFPPFSGGGIGTYAHAITQTLVRRGEKPVVITVGDGAESESLQDGVVVVRLPLVKDDDWASPHPLVRDTVSVAAWNALGPHSVFSMLVADALPALIQKHGIDLVEFADTGASGWFTLNRRRNLGTFGDVQMLTNVHSPSAWIEENNRRCEPGRMMHELQRMEHEQARWSDAVITPSQYMANWVLQNWDLSASVMRNPLPPLEQSSEEPEDDGVLFVGRLEYRKGIDTLCRAWGKLLSTTHRLHLVGQDVPDERTGVPIGEHLLSSMPREVSLRVVEHGPMSPASVHAFQNTANVVVVPSPVDNLPYTCVEAMAAGRVVVASDIGGASELIEDGISGLLFASGDCKSLAAVLERAIDMTSQERATMGGHAQDRISSMCGADEIIAARRAHAGSIEHWRDIMSDAECVAINATSVIDPLMQKLCDAVTNSGAAFAIGWPKTAKRVVAHGTPSLAGMLAGPREVGPIVVRSQWLDRPEIGELIPDRQGKTANTRDAWKLLASIMAAGGEGVVVPEAVLETCEPASRTISLDVRKLVSTSIVLGEPGTPIGRAIRLAHAFEGQSDTIKSRVMGSARKLLGG